MRSFKMIVVLIAFSSVSLFAQSAEELFNEKCVICHTAVKPTAEARSSFIAPPVMGVMFHVKEAFGGDKQKVIAFIKDYVLEPSEKKAKCLPKSIKRFGLMPSQKGNVTEEELEKIAEYMYENFPQRGFEPKQQRY
ncbi:c-type cytochrome [Sulfurimonas sp.]|uniref:c-type cytochrome n=1 Tax=Sulfurimonas sp. TaxID=2022749 RepID=UPI003D10EF0B